MHVRPQAWIAIALLAAACTSSSDDRGASSPDGAASGAGGSAGSSAASGGARSSGGSSSGGAGTATGGALGGASSNGGAGNGGAVTGGSPNPGGMPGSGGSQSAGGADAGTVPATRILYVGTGDYAGSNGAVLVYEADTTTWALTRRERTAAGDLASFLAASPDRRTLYATDEAAGMVRSFRIDATTGLLSALPAQASNGHPTHVTAHPAGRFVLVAHYNEGRVEVFGTAASGAATGAVDEDASGSQAHEAVVSPDGRFVFVPNKGTHTISQYVFDAATGALSPNTPPSVASEAGAGPRHLAFTPDARFAYVIDELGNQVEAFTYDAAAGTLAHFQTIDSLPASAGASSGAEIEIAPSGRFLYCSNRITGADGDIAIFAIGATDGRLTLVDHESTRGRTPRHFSLDPTGLALFVANQASREVVVFRVDPATGLLTFATETSVGEDAYFVGAFAAR